MIGITASVYQPVDGRLERNGQNRQYVEAVIAAGGLPLIVPTCDDPQLLAQLVGVLDGVILAGGDDIAPSRYGQLPSPLLSQFSEARDAAELALLDEARRAELPVLGICRGMQLLNVALGGSLYQDLVSERPGSSFHGAGTTQRATDEIEHVLTVEPGSHLAQAVGPDPLPANSYHHQGIRKLGDGLIATAWAEDGLVEAVELPEAAYIVGVQCHPESLVADEGSRWRGLFAGFVAAAASGATSSAALHRGDHAVSVGAPAPEAAATKARASKV